MNKIQQYISDKKLNTMRLIGVKFSHESLSSNRYISIVNPYTQEVIGNIPKATVEDVRDALRIMNDYRSELSSFERAEILNRAANIVKERSQEIAELICSESGLSINDALYEANRVCNVLTFGANEVLNNDDKIFDCDITSDLKRRRVYTQQEPLIGVISAITPFNHPMNQVAHKVVPSIATNNCMILKPSEKTPFSAVLFADILYEAGLPSEMLSVVTGDPLEIGDELITNSFIDMVSFTGSVKVGKYIASKVGYKRIILELGGNDPLIVMEDANIDRASTLAVEGSYKNSGQRCTAIKRMLVHSKVADQFVELLVDKTKEWSYGDPLDMSNKMGTLIDEDAAKVFEKIVNDAKKSGARLLVGGSRKGALFAPTVLDNIHPDMKLVKHEAFAPISSVIKFDNIDEAIKISNGTGYGLSSAIMTNQLNYINQFIKELQVGNVNIDEVPGYRLEHAPFGGIKNSGLGYKEGVQEAMNSFSNIKTYSLPLK